jgi:hypothetical protein
LRSGRACFALRVLLPCLSLRPFGALWAWRACFAHRTLCASFALISFWSLRAWRACFALHALLPCFSFRALLSLLLLSRPVVPAVRAGLGLPALPEALGVLESLDPPWPLEPRRAPRLPPLLGGPVGLQFPGRLLRPEALEDLDHPLPLGDPEDLGPPWGPR